MRWILITGAMGGMGRATAEALRQGGYGVIALDRECGEALDTDNLKHISADITDGNSLSLAYERVCAITDSLYAVIHFAGVYMLDSLVEIEDERIRKIFDVNLFGVYAVNKTFLPLLTEGSRIVITTSELATLPPLPFTGIYAISKAALDRYAYSLRMELQLLGIQVSVLRAGAVDTGMLGTSMAELDNFLEKTRLYRTNATRFKKIVNAVESKSISTGRIASRVAKIVNKRSARFAYSINRNPLLRLYGITPSALRFFAISKILK